MNIDQVIDALQHCMAEPYCIDYKHHNCSKCNQRIAQDLAIKLITAYNSACDIKWMINNIPIEFIESEIQRVLNLSEEAAKAGDIGRAKMYSAVVQTFEALLTNWLYVSGPKWMDQHE